MIAGRVPAAVRVMTHVPRSCRIVVIGGGPAGATIARLLASSGHAVTTVARAIDERRGIAESLPPSTRKVLAAIGVLELVETGGAFRNVGNTVWWGGGEGRIEDFRAAGEASGLQIWRPDFDRLLVGEAVRSGVTWITGNASEVEFLDDCARTAVVLPDGTTTSVTSQFVVDASGRSAVLGRASRRPIPGRRTSAWIGSWSHQHATALTGETRTLVETVDDGWVWSVPVSPTERCVTVMIDPDRTRFAREGALEQRYLGELSKAGHIHALLDGASLQRVWGCDASLYETADLGGPRHLIVGDAASFIDPLSSFGVKKALTSAWMGAAVVHTCLTDAAVEPAARELFATREREAYASSVRLSADYAALAAIHHNTPFWRIRTEVPEALAFVSSELTTEIDVVRAFEDLRTRPDVHLRPAPDVRFEWQPAFRGDRVELERAVTSDTLARPVRFVESIDLTRLVEMAAHYRQVGDLFTGYCERERPVPLPSFLRALSVLVATRVLEPADC